MLLLTACGGGELSTPTEQNSSRQLNAGTRPVSLSNATGAHSCVVQVDRALRENAKSVDADCLSGTWSGVDAQGKACMLHMARNNGHFRFIESDTSLSVEADAVGARGRPPIHAIERANVNAGQVGLQWVRRGEGSEDLETLVVASGETRKGHLDLASVSFSREQSGSVTVLRCFFDT